MRKACLWNVRYGWKRPPDEHPQMDSHIRTLRPTDGWIGQCEWSNGEVSRLFTLEVDKAYITSFRAGDAQDAQRSGPLLEALQRPSAGGK
jgi:hypothetical protein